MAAMAWCAQAGEYAVLASGARLRVDRHEAAGDKVRLFLHGGSTEMPAGEVTGFEAEEQVAAAPAAVLPSIAAPAADPHVLIAAAAKKYGVPEKLLHSVIKAESGYRADAVSPKGAVGLMQLMPATARAYGVDARDPAQNVEAGTRYLTELLLKYDGGLYHALAAYNAGPGAVEKYKGVPPYRETQDYIRRILQSWTKK